MKAKDLTVVRMKLKKDTIITSKLIDTEQIFGDIRNMQKIVKCKTELRVIRRSKSGGTNGFDRKGTAVVCLKHLR